MTQKSTATEVTILVILANPSLQEEMDELLRNTTFRLEFANSAETGLRQAEELLPTAIVLDIDPQLDCYETCRRLRANRLLGHVPIILLTSRRNRDERAAGLSAGADDFIEKPLDGLELLSRLGTITRLNTQRALLSHLSRFTWMAEIGRASCRERV